MPSMGRGLCRGRRCGRVPTARCRDRPVKTAAVSLRHVGEQEGAALFLVKAALDLPARQRTQLGVLLAV
jgi:hypothetical protein